MLIAQLKEKTTIISRAFPTYVVERAEAAIMAELESMTTDEYPRTIGELLAVELLFSLASYYKFAATPLFGESLAGEISTKFCLSNTTSSKVVEASISALSGVGVPFEDHTTNHDFLCFLVAEAFSENHSKATSTKSSVLSNLKSRVLDSICSESSFDYEFLSTLDQEIESSYESVCAFTGRDVWANDLYLLSVDTPLPDNLQIGTEFGGALWVLETCFYIGSHSSVSFNDLFTYLEQSLGKFDYYIFEDILSYLKTSRLVIVSLEKNTEAYFLSDAGYHLTANYAAHKFLTMPISGEQCERTNETWLTAIIHQEAAHSIRELIVEENLCVPPKAITALAVATKKFHCEDFSRKMGEFLTMSIRNNTNPYIRKSAIEALHGTYRELLTDNIIEEIITKDSSEIVQSTIVKICL